MDTYDQMIVDNGYPGEIDNEKYLFSNHQQQILNKDEDGNGPLGRRVYLESPSFDNKEEEDMYRYVPSRITDRTSSIIGTTIPTRKGETLMDSLDFELGIHGGNNTRSEIPYRQLPKPVAATRQLSNLPRANPRQDPLLGPLLAELDAMSNHQVPLSSSPIYRHDSVPYESNLIRPNGSSPPNHALTNVANRTVNDALFQSELYNSRDRKDQQQTISSSAPNLNSSNQSRPLNMDNTDIFLPSSYATGSGSFLSHFGPEDQLFQRPLLHTLGQNYVQNPRPPQQHDATFDQTHTRISPPQRTTYAPPHLPRNYVNEQQSSSSSNPFIDYQRAPPQQRYDEQMSRQINPSNNQENFFIDHNNDQLEQQQIRQRSGEQQDQDSKRQTVWNELQRTNAKFQEKPVKKHESPNRLKPPFGSNPTWNTSGSQQSSAISKSPQRPLHHPPPPPPLSKPNYIEENIDMIKNKESFYHRYPARKYENSYSRRKDLHSGSVHGKQEQEQDQEPKTQLSPNNSQRPSNLPVTVNVNPGENSQSGSLPATVTIPLDSHISRAGDKISVNIDLRLVDLQNLQQQQQQGGDNPHWASTDPLDRHIRKLERNIEQSLPTTQSPERSPVTRNTGGRYGRQPIGAGRGGYNPPVYGGDYYNYSDKGREEDSYLAKLNNTKRVPQFKPYTGRDYEQFKKNYGFGTGHLGYDFENTNHREKTEKLAKTRQYAQQIEARNKKKISEMSRRALSDSRLPKAPRLYEYPPSAIWHKKLSGNSTHSSPPVLSKIVSFIPARRPTEVLYRPASMKRQLPKLSQYENNEIVQRDNIPIKNTINPSQKRREERLVQDRTNQRRLSPPKHFPPIGNNKRRPIRFDNEPTLQQQPNDETTVMEVIRQELTERPLNSDEELVIVEQ